MKLHTCSRIHFHVQSPAYAHARARAHVHVHHVHAHLQPHPTPHTHTKLVLLLTVSSHLKVAMAASMTSFISSRRRRVALAGRRLCNGVRTHQQTHKSILTHTNTRKHVYSHIHAIAHEHTKQNHLKGTTAIPLFLLWERYYPYYPF